MSSDPINPIIIDKPHESYLFMSTLNRLLYKMRAVLLGQHDILAPRASLNDNEVNERMIQKTLRLEWWMCYQTAKSNDYPYSLKMSIIDDSINNIVNNVGIRAKLIEKHLHDLEITLYHIGDSDRYSGKLRNLLRTLDRFIKYSVKWENFTGRVDGILITEDGLSARIAIPLSAERKPTNRLLSIVLSTDPLKRGSLKRMQELVANSDKTSLVPVLSTPSLYDDDNSGEHIGKVVENINDLDEIRYVAANRSRRNSIKLEVEPQVCQYIPENNSKPLKEVTSPIPRPYIEPSIYQKLFGVLNQLGADMK